MSKVVICITGDIDFDRRILRTRQALSKEHDVQVLSRKLHKQGEQNKISCIFNKGFLFYAEYNIRLFFILLFKKMDIIVAVDYDTLIPTALIAKLRGKKLVFDAHELFEESIEIARRPRLKSFWKQIGERYIPAADRAYTVCDSIANFYTEKFGKQFRVIRNVPVLDSSSSIIARPPEQIIIYQGVLNEGRKLELLLDAVHHLPENYRVWIIGEGDISDRLKARAGKRILFFSWVKPERLREYTSQAFLAYNLLDEGSKSYYFSLANKFFDYIHAGVPSLNNSFPEYEYYNQRYNCCYNKNIESAAALAEWILSISDNIHVWKEKRKNSFLAAQDLNWQKEQKKLLKVYDFDSHSDLQ